MKSTKPFDLELAKAGHPLRTENGVVMNYVGCSKSLDFPVILARESDNELYKYTVDGRTRTGLPIFLDTSKKWEAPLKQGDIIEVLINKKWEDSAYICPIPKGEFLSTDPQYNDPDALNKGNVDCDEIKLFCDKDEGIDWRRKPTESDIEITVKINGKFISLKDISEETLLKIRNS